MSKKPVIYIASPYTKGDQAINTHFQCKIFNELLDEDIILPFVPLWSHFQHILFPRHYQDWIDYDLEILHIFDGCLRLNSEYPSLGYKVSESSGADGEVAKFKELDKPVFYSIEECYEWAKQQ